MGSFLMKLRSFRLLLAAFALCAVSEGGAFAQKESIGWTDYLGGPESSHYSPLKQINVSNVNRIEAAWTYPAEDGMSVFCPLVVDNIAYISAKGGALVALDATSGKELWVHSFGTGGGGRGGIAGERGGNYWESKDRKDRRIIVTSGGYLHEVDAVTGNTVDSFADHGKLDLKIGIDRAPIPLASRTPGRVFEDLIILGSFPGEGYLAPPGDIRAFDVRTGKLVWVFHTIPRPCELGYDTWPKDAYKYMGGVDVWGEITLDERRGIAYFPVSDAKYELYGGDRPGNNLFADSLLALDARTGKYLWHFQTVHHDLWDYDPAAAPQLATVKHDGKTVDVVALATKTGFLYVFDRVTGEPLWPIEERPVPKSEVPGEQTSPTQPFPTMPPPFARQSFTQKDLYTGFMTTEEQAQWEERLAKAQNKGLFTPPGLTDTVSIPGVNGGALFWDTGADAANGMVFVESKDFPSILKLVKEGESIAANRGGTIPSRTEPGGRGRGGFGFGMAGGPPMALQYGRTVYEGSCQVCHGPDLKGDRGPQIDDAVKRLSADAVRNIIKNGRGGMPAFPTMNAEAITDVIEFLQKPEQAPPGTGVPGNSLMERMEPSYPAWVTPPPSRYKTGYGQEGYIIKPPWSTITAYDLNTGQIMWQTPYGDTPEAGPSNKLRGNVTPRSGFVVTAGGLVLFADNQSKLYALDEKTGKVVYSRDVPNSAVGVPAVYAVNGREYVLFSLLGGPGFPAGARMPQRGVSPPAGEKCYVAFALPQ
jgi:quinoprotein glucose dehydrogenase